MTAPNENPTPDETTEDGSGVAGALAAASHEDENAGDPLGPLNAVTEDDADSGPDRRG